MDCVVVDEPCRAESPADGMPLWELLVGVRLRVVSPPAELPPRLPLGCRRLTGPCGGADDRLIPIDGADRMAAWLRLAPMEPWLPPPIEPWPALLPWPPASSALEGAIRIVAAMQVFKERNMAWSFAGVGPVVVMLAISLSRRSGGCDSVR
jgi:hypothetical protein